MMTQVSKKVRYVLEQFKNLPIGIKAFLGISAVYMDFVGLIY